MPFGLSDADYYDPAKLHEEEDRIFTICQDCRLCFKFCASFPALFDGFDAADQTIAGVTDHVRETVLDHCFQCKLCYVRCPYTPPHEWAVDFPALMLRRKAQRARTRGIPLGDKFLSDIDRAGAFGTMFAPFTNILNNNPVNRILLERVMGIHRDRNLPPFASETFEKWLAKQPATPAPAAPTGKVVLFHTCFGNYNGPQIAKAAKRVLEHNGCVVAHPPQNCCGMPNLDSGDVPGAQAKIRQQVKALADLVRDGYAIAVPNPTCGLMLKQEWPHLVEDDPDVTLVSEHTFDLMEYLWTLKEAGTLQTEFQSGAGKVAYHAPCHLRKQEAGFRGRDLLQLLPDTEVTLIQQCSAHDGTWSAKREYFEESMKYGKKLFDAIEKAEPQTLVSDCPLASIQVDQALNRHPIHPVQVLAQAYGLPAD